MGNEQGCCYQMNNPQQNAKTKSLKPLKYGSRIFKYQQQKLNNNNNNNKNNNNNNNNNQNSNQIDHSNININYKNIQDYLHEHKQVNNKDYNKNIKIEQQHDLKQLLRYKQQRLKYTVSQQIQPLQQRIEMMYPQIVKQILQRQKPFQQELSQIPCSLLKTIRLPNNDIYQGQLDSLSRPQGIASILKPNNNFLIGEVFFIFTQNGSYYKGLMKNNKAHDLKGKFNCEKFMYIGGFQDNMFNGDGQEIGHDYCFKGKYKHNKRVEGVFKWGLNNNNEGDNYFNIFGYENTNGYKMIKQQQQHPNNNNNNTTIINNNNNNHSEPKIPPERSFTSDLSYLYQYQGSFSPSQNFTGYSSLTSPSGTYKGQFHEGKKHGKGIYLYKSLLKYDGDYYEDKKSGYGILYNCDNTIAYQGQWKDGLPHGNGVSYDLKGKKTEGKFKNGLNVNLLDQDDKTSQSNRDNNNYKRPF